MKRHEENNYQYRNRLIKILVDNKIWISANTYPIANPPINPSDRVQYIVSDGKTYLYGDNKGYIPFMYLLDSANKYRNEKREQIELLDNKK